MGNIFKFGWEAFPLGFGNVSITPSNKIGSNFQVGKGSVSQCEWEMFPCRNGNNFLQEFYTGNEKSFLMCIGNISE